MADNKEKVTATDCVVSFLERHGDNIKEVIIVARLHEGGTAYESTTPSVVDQMSMLHYTEEWIKSDHFKRGI